MRLKDKVIIITGASSGIGASAALRFAREGAALVLGARRGEALAQLVNTIADTPGRAIAVPGDVTDPGYAQTLVARAASVFGGLDGAFNNAGTLGPMGPLPDLKPADWAQVIDTNLTAAFHAARAQIPALRERGGGSLIFTSSFVGPVLGLPGMGAYAAAKAGLVGLVRAIAADEGPAGIRANALLPGGTNTPMAAAFGDDPAVADYVRGLHALKRTAEPDEIAAAALFLASDDASFVTGTAFLADGGNASTKT